MPTGGNSRSKARSSVDPPLATPAGTSPKETIRFEKRTQTKEESELTDGQPVSFPSPPGLTPVPKVKSALCFPETTKVRCAECRQCQYCHDYCCRSTEGHVSHRCAQHINW